MNHGPGLVITPCQELARYTRFQVALRSMQTPPGSQWVPAVGLSVVENLNAGLRNLRPEDEWVWFIGDDHVFDPDTVIRLLDRELDVVAPLCCQRAAPWPLVHYSGPLEVEGYYANIQYDELPDGDEPFEVHRTGSAMLVRRHVIDAIGDPWFQTTHDLINEDLDFCAKVKAAGFKIHVDPTVSIGHIGHVVVKPARENGVWGLDIAHVGFAETHQFLPGGMSEYANLGELEAASA